MFKLSDQLKKFAQEGLIMGIKSEFETECTELFHNLILKDIAQKNGLNFTIKLGGASCLNDVEAAKTLGADAIVAPMVESEYAMSKFLQTAAFFKTKYFINIETGLAVQNLDAILNSPHVGKLAGIIIGRSDLASSLNTQPCQILDVVEKIVLRVRKTPLLIGIGGEITPNSLNFLKHLNVDFFETRKIIFHPKTLHSNEANEAINAALRFEIDWLNFRQNSRNCLNPTEKSRLNKLQSRIVCAKILIKEQKI